MSAPDKRYLRPAAKELGIALGGWHDFRHTLSTQLLRRYSTKVVSELLGHSSVQTTLNVYQQVEPEQFRAPLNEMATELLPDVTQSAGSNGVLPPNTVVLTYDDGSTQYTATLGSYLNQQGIHATMVNTLFRSTIDNQSYSS